VVQVPLDLFHHQALWFPGLPDRHAARQDIFRSRVKSNGCPCRAENALHHHLAHSSRRQGVIMCCRRATGTRTPPRHHHRKTGEPSARPAPGRSNFSPGPPDLMRSPPMIRYADPMVSDVPSISGRPCRPSTYPVVTTPQVRTRRKNSARHGRPFRAVKPSMPCQAMWSVRTGSERARFHWTSARFSERGKVSTLTVGASRQVLTQCGAPPPPPRGHLR